MSEESRMSRIRAVFAAMFDAVVAEPDWTEDRWVDLIHALDVTGRMVFGWPHLESSESDIFGALDDIAAQLEGTKKAIEQTTSEARSVMFELHEALGPDSDPSPDPAPSATLASLSDASQATFSTPDVKQSAIEPVTPTADDEVMFAAIRGLGLTGSYNDIDRMLNRTPSTSYQRLKLLDKYGSLPADIVTWRKDHKAPRGPKADHPWKSSRVVRDDGPSDAEPSESFEERRVRYAREKANAAMDERRLVVAKVG